ncbi:hypothetical protein BV898_18739 [Hypsibius exemplaris]|uniref:Uncharacterized protein n=1 Tax=Hypsibius exemplaris TaxID=2072580 RepID=A0A9X6NK71_HYPEX|nr:hypothetical protein BV898_18739 [Hypsibius exemplaris]
MLDQKLIHPKGLELCRGIQIGNWSVIFIIDCCLLIVLRRHLKTRKTLFHAPERVPAAGRGSQGSDSALRLVIACSALYVFTIALSITSNILLIAKKPPCYSYYITTKTSNLLSALRTLSLLVNYSAGIFLYCLTWKRFRERIKCWVRLWHQRRPDASDAIPLRRRTILRVIKSEKEEDIPSKTEVKNVNNGDYLLSAPTTS